MDSVENIRRGRHFTRTYIELDHPPEKTHPEEATAWRDMRFLAISCRQKGHVLPPLPLIEAQNGYHPTTFL